jgi:hypothetical protein
MLVFSAVKLSRGKPKTNQDAEELVQKIEEPRWRSNILLIKRDKTVISHRIPK